MAYARYERGRSDIYVFRNLQGEIECVSCRLSPDGKGWWETRYFTELKDLYVHLMGHRMAGHLVPDETLQRVAEEMCQ